MLYVENSLPSVGLTTLPHLIRLDKKIDTQNWPTVGRFFKEGVVTAINPKEGCQIALPESPINAYLPKSRIKDSVKLEDATAAQHAAKSAALTEHLVAHFSKDAKVPLCRVTKHALIEGVVHVSTQPSILDMPFLRPEDAVPGTKCEGVIKKVYDGKKGSDRTGLLVDVAGVYGWISKLHLADVLLGQNMISKKFKEGAKIKCRVRLFFLSHSSDVVSYIIYDRFCSLISLVPGCS